MNAVAHTHLCFEEFIQKGATRIYTCYSPECATLPGVQGNCPTCGYLHGWAQAVDRTLSDQWSNWA